MKFVFLPTLNGQCSPSWLRITSGPPSSRYGLLPRGLQDTLFMVVSMRADTFRDGFGRVNLGSI
ncbi:hypothetical protein SCLCIDRAFT_1223032 [Scleroderma citrinum Foug A]|uniref:Uncharacterized protein n=1 Tax=Scleroderma citrinum Foug A TaxID=1036808 RepID=A0A0C2ZKM3_9AGAM|nr:hypothetical protein SCLCIDRAFT_1223032 [Scleroderma citrinum Foug A]